MEATRTNPDIRHGLTPVPPPSFDSNWHVQNPTRAARKKLAGQRGEDAVAHEMAMMKVYCYEVAERMHSAGKEALLAFAEGDELKGMLMGLKRFTKTEPFNTAAARQAIAQKLIEENEYCW